MSVAELIPQIRTLSRKEQLLLIHCLLDELGAPDLTREQRLLEEFAAGGPYEIYTPEFSEGAAAVLDEYLKAQAPPR
jgi:hypothetical protein